VGHRGIEQSDRARDGRKLQKGSVPEREAGARTMFKGSLKYQTLRFRQIETVLERRQGTALRKSDLLDTLQRRQEYTERLRRCKSNEVLNLGPHAR
jgi:hypothetical protein